LKTEWWIYKVAVAVARWPSWAVSLVGRYGKSQLVNVVGAVLLDGFMSWVVEANRMSGDLNTGGGNSVLQSTYIASSMEHLGVPERAWRMYVDGDDAVLLLERAFISYIDDGKLEATMSRFAQVAKVSKVEHISETNMESMEFCQSRPVMVDGEWRFVRDPKKVVNCYLRSFRWSKTPKLLRQYFATISPPEMIINAGVPVLDAFFRMIHRLSGDEKPLDRVFLSYWARSADGLEHSSTVGTVSTGSRRSFELAFGMTIAEQLRLESIYDATTFELSPNPSWETI